MFILTDGGVYVLWWFDEIFMKFTSCFAHRQAGSLRTLMPRKGDLQ